MSRTLLSLVACLLVVGCDDSRPTFRDGGGGGGVDANMISPFVDSGPPGDGGPGDSLCGSAAEGYVYLVDSSDAFLRFDPATNVITPLGTLSCATSSSPFSMAVDRDANAWVLYQDGHIFRVSVTDVSCTATSFVAGQSGFDVFGMGFVSDAAGSADETLFVAGGSLLDISFGAARLGRVDDALALSAVGDLPGWPELTGTGAAELWGFFPDTSPPSVRQIDKSTGATTRSFPISEISSGSGLGDTAWAFAFWGGRFYVFYKGDADLTTNVWRLDPADGSVLEVLHESGYRIVGAGVSTCAPIILI
ncbi:MAG: hypothetical protein H6719_03240 [Sandaracinaceae bacterium]|nr:hypothetical protein [Sandaracinaceae bacterium]